MDAQALTRAAARAMRSLDPQDQRRAASVGERLGRLWVHESPFLPIASTMSTLLPGTVFSLYTRSQDGGLDELAIKIDGRLSSSWEDFPFAQHLPQLAQYHLSRPDPWANLPVNTRALYRGRPERLALFRERVLRPLGAFFQLRAVLYDQQHFLAWVGFLGGRSQGDFGRRESALLAAVLPAVADGLAAARAIHSARMTFDSFDRSLDLFEEPAFLLTERGTVVFANRAARRCGPMPQWLGCWTRDPFSEWACRMARGRRIEAAGKALWLVLPRTWWGTCAEPGALLAGVPRSLRRVAEPLLRGLSDKEIAASTGLSLSSVRTYLARLYRRLNVHSRAELVARLLLEGQELRPGERRLT